MAGYSGTPLPKKLGIGPAGRVCLINEPAGFRDHLNPLPPSVSVETNGAGPFDVILLFCHDKATLQSRFGPATTRLAATGGLWICWPKKASGLTTDLTENVLRDICLASKLVDNKVCAVTEIWSGLRFVVRVEHRASWTPERD